MLTSDDRLSCAALFVSLLGMAISAVFLLMSLVMWGGLTPDSTTYLKSWVGAVQYLIFAGPVALALTAYRPKLTFPLVAGQIALLIWGWLEA